MSATPLRRLASLGVYGFDRQEPVILAALVTEDPLLLIGASGTGKTYLLNTLSEVLRLEHRHYNASLISFDDLVGFPYPEADHGSVRFLETPATVWGAESVLIDEISRCKPEHQNRLFALVHERRVQGIPLPKLRYRWAAMNPCSSDQEGVEDYTGSEALDHALADRFSLFIKAADWLDLGDEEKLKIATPDGEGRLADDGGALLADVGTWRNEFLSRVGNCPERVLVYATAVVSALNTAGVRISPRRSRLIARSLLAACIVSGDESEALFRLILDASIPQPCWGANVSPPALAAAHQVAWDSAVATQRRWLHAFAAEKRLDRKLAILFDRCDGPDSGTQAVAELLASEPPERAAAFAFSTFPAAVGGKLPIGAEGVNDLGRLASQFLSADGEICWNERYWDRNTLHPDFVRYARVLEKLKGGRAERARQFFNACLVRKVKIDQPAGLEEEIEGCVELLRDRGLA